MPLPANIYEPSRGLAYLESALGAVNPHGAWQGVGPESSTPPFTVFDLASGVDMTVVGAYRIWNDGLYLVKAVGPQSSAAAVYAQADANDNALTRQGGITVGPQSDATLLYCVRESIVPLPPELVNGVPWMSVGGYYRMYVQAR